MAPARPADWSTSFSAPWIAGDGHVVARGADRDVGEGGAAPAPADVGGDPVAAERDRAVGVDPERELAEQRLGAGQAERVVGARAPPRAAEVDALADQPVAAQRSPRSRLASVKPQISTPGLDPEPERRRRSWSRHHDLGAADRRVGRDVADRQRARRRRRQRAPGACHRPERRAGRRWSGPSRRNRATACATPPGSSAAWPHRSASRSSPSGSGTRPGAAWTAVAAAVHRGHAQRERPARHRHPAGLRGGLHGGGLDRRRERRRFGDRHQVGVSVDQDGTGAGRPWIVEGRRAGARGRRAHRPRRGAQGAAVASGRHRSRAARGDAGRPISPGTWCRGPLACGDRDRRPRRPGSHRAAAACSRPSVPSASPSSTRSGRRAPICPTASTARTRSAELREAHGGAGAGHRDRRARHRRRAADAARATRAS